MHFEYTSFRQYSKGSRVPTSGFRYNFNQSVEGSSPSGDTLRKPTLGHGIGGVAS
jgi:hypothetical protein